jgi:hypothetical protein
MAATWRACSQTVAFASGKSMIDVFNATGSARIIRVYRMFQWNNTVTAISGSLTIMTIRRITAASSGTTVTPIKHDTNSSSLDANTTCGTGRTVTGSDVFRKYLWAAEEPVLTAVAQPNWELLIPNAEVWNAGYGDTNIEPLVCRAVQGVELRQEGSLAVHSNDFEIEFTDAAS